MSENCFNSKFTIFLVFDIYYILYHYQVVTHQRYITRRILSLSIYYKTNLYIATIIKVFRTQRLTWLFNIFAQIKFRQIEPLKMIRRANCSYETFWAELFKKIAWLVDWTGRFLSVNRYLRTFRKRSRIDLGPPRLCRMVLTRFRHVRRNSDRASRTRGLSAPLIAVVEKRPKSWHLPSKIQSFDLNVKKRFFFVK